MTKKFDVEEQKDALYGIVESWIENADDDKLMEAWNDCAEASGDPVLHEMNQYDIQDHFYDPFNALWEAIEDGNFEMRDSYWYEDKWGNLRSCDYVSDLLDYYSGELKGFLFDNLEYYLATTDVNDEMREQFRDWFMDCANDDDSEEYDFELLRTCMDEAVHADTFKYDEDWEEVGKRILDDYHDRLVPSADRVAQIIAHSIGWGADVRIINHNGEAVVTVASLLNTKCYTCNPEELYKAMLEMGKVKEEPKVEEAVEDKSEEEYE